MLRCEARQRVDGLSFLFPLAVHLQDSALKELKGQASDPPAQLLQPDPESCIERSPPEPDTMEDPQSPGSVSTRGPGGASGDLS